MVNEYLGKQADEKRDTQARGVGKKYRPFEQGEEQEGTKTKQDMLKEFE